jgi:hypothetical protein
VLRAGYSIFYNGSIYGECPAGSRHSRPSHKNLDSDQSDFPPEPGFTRASTKTINNGSW